MSFCVLDFIPEEAERYAMVIADPADGGLHYQRDKS